MMNQIRSVTVRFADVTDAEKLLAIYAPYIQNTSITFEYDIPSVSEFEKRIKAVTTQFPWLICEVGGEFAGYVYAAAHHERAAFQWDAEVSVYLAERFHRFGIASALYQCLFELLAEQGCCNLYALITVPNEQSIGFHQSCGFRQVGMQPHVGYKFGKWYGMSTLEKPLRDFNEPVVPTPTKTVHQLNEEFVKLTLKKCEENIKNKAKHLN